MNLELDDEQRMLEESVDRLLADLYGPDERRRAMAGSRGFSEEMWRAFVDLGLTTVPFLARDGGLELGAMGTMVIGEAFGRALVVEPYLSSVVLGGTAIARFGSDAQRQRWLPGLIDGSTLAAFADRAEGRAVRKGEGWRLDGAASLVLGGAGAHLIVVPSDDGMFVIPSDDPGLSRRGYRLHGGGTAADCRLQAVMVGNESRLDETASGAEVIEAGVAFLAAEAAGAMQAALGLTIEHLKAREQFGRPLGANQALRHRAAEMAVEVEQARSAALLGALLAHEPDARTRARGYAAVKVVIGKAGRFVAQQAVQLHGGIGVSEEHAISHYFRRLTAIGMLLGDTEHAIARLAALADEDEGRER